MLRLAPILRAASAISVPALIALSVACASPVAPSPATERSPDPTVFPEAPVAETPVAIAERAVTEAATPEIAVAAATETATAETGVPETATAEAAVTEAAAATEPTAALEASAGRASCWCFHWVHGRDHGIDCLPTAGRCRRDRARSTRDSTPCRHSTAEGDHCTRVGYIGGRRQVLPVD